MQGTAADLIKLAMVEIDKKITRKQTDIKMIMQVHDELVFEIKEDLAPEALGEIIEIMGISREISVPLTVDAGTGQNWDQAH